MKIRNNILTLILLSAVLWLQCDFITKEIENDLGDVVENINYDGFRIHQPLKSDLDNNNSIITTANNASLRFDIFSLDPNNPDCIVNPAGLTDFKIVEVGPENYAVEYGVHQDYPTPSSENLYPIGIIIEDTTKQYLNAYRFRYADDITGRINLETAIRGSNLDIKVLSEKGGQANLSRELIYFEDSSVMITFPSGLMKNCNSDGLSTSAKRTFDTWVTRISAETNSSITRNSAFPLPVLASSFKSNLNGLSIDTDTIIAEFTDATYIGLDVLHNGGKTKTKANLFKKSDDGDALIEVKVILNNDITSSESRQVWRFYQDCSTKEYIWERIPSEIDALTNSISFKSALSIGWVICTNIEQYCGDISPSNPLPLYAKVTLNHNNNVLGEDLYTAELFDDATGDLIISNMLFSSNTISIYGLTGISTKLKIYRKTLNGKVLITETDLNCGDRAILDFSDLPDLPVTKLNVDVLYASCSNSDSNNSIPRLERSLKIFAHETPLANNCPSASDTSWKELGFLKKGLFETSLLEHGKSYCFMVYATYYGGTRKVFHRPIEIINEGLKPTRDPLPTNTSPETGKLLCEEIPINSGNYNCSFIIDNTAPVDLLYLSNYCGF